LGCWTTHLSPAFLVSVDPTTGGLVRRGPALALSSVQAVSPAALVGLAGSTLRLVDLATGQAVTMALPLVPSQQARLASGALATAVRNDGQDEASWTLTVYESADPPLPQ
jgi:hypothetical protein